MDRRSNTVQGFINFPVNDPSYRNTNEGGMFVRLLVRENYSDCGALVCTGGHNNYFWDEELLGEDNSEPPGPPDLIEAWPAWQDAEDAWFVERFPNWKSSKTEFRFVSASVLAVITLGSTGWSGFSDADKKYFICKYEHLNDEGRVLYHALKRLYPKCQIVLQTWLDT